MIRVDHYDSGRLGTQDNHAHSTVVSTTHTPKTYQMWNVLLELLTEVPKSTAKTYVHLRLIQTREQKLLICIAIVHFYMTKIISKETDLNTHRLQVLK